MFWNKQKQELNIKVTTHVKTSCNRIWHFDKYMSDKELTEYLKKLGFWCANVSYDVQLPCGVHLQREGELNCNTCRIKW